MISQGISGASGNAFLGQPDEWLEEEPRQRIHQKHMGQQRSSRLAESRNERKHQEKSLHRGQRQCDGLQALERALKESQYRSHREKTSSNHEQCQHNGVVSNGIEMRKKRDDKYAQQTRISEDACQKQKQRQSEEDDYEFQEQMVDQSMIAGWRAYVKELEEHIEEVGTQDTTTKVEAEENVIVLENSNGIEVKEKRSAKEGGRDFTTGMGSLQHKTHSRQQDVRTSWMEPSKEDFQGSRADRMVEEMIKDTFGVSPSCSLSNSPSPERLQPPSACVLALGPPELAVLPSKCVDAQQPPNLLQTHGKLFEFGADCVITQEATLKVMDMEHFQTQRDSEADQLFDAVDTDKDGVISRKEWTQAFGDVKVEEQTHFPRYTRKELQVKMLTGGNAEQLVKDMSTAMMKQEVDSV